MRKVYWAVVEPSLSGELPPAEGVWEDWLLKVKEQVPASALQRTHRVRVGPCCVIGACATARAGRFWR